MTLMLDTGYLMLDKARNDFAIKGFSESISQINSHNDILGTSLDN